MTAEASLPIPAPCGGSASDALPAGTAFVYKPAAEAMLAPTSDKSGGTAAQADADPSTRGSAGRFALQSLLAAGGLGQVWLAIDRELDRPVALKELRPELAEHPARQARFWREARITGILEHPGVPPVYGLGVDDQGRPYYAMRLIRGESLEKAIARYHSTDGNACALGRDLSHARSVDRPMQPQAEAGRESSPDTTAGSRSLALRELVGRMIDVCHTIEFAHSRGFVHRDIKPANIMLGEYGETIVVDWGLARPIGKEDPRDADTARDRGEVSAPSGHTPTRMGVALGTPQFMSPEQAAGAHDQVGPASDVYSLGATLYMLLTGVPPFNLCRVADILYAVITGDLVPPRQVRPEIHPALEAVCLKAMALTPEARYASARALAEDLHRWLADEPVAAWCEPWSHRLWRQMRKYRRASLAVAALLLVATCLSIAVACVVHQARISAEKAHRERTWTQVEALRSASPQAVPHLLRAMQPSREQWEPAVQALLRSPRLSQGERRRLALAMLDDHPQAVRWLARQMLQVPEEDEYRLLRSALEPYRDRLEPALWRLVVDKHAPLRMKVRAARSLAVFAPDSSRWHAAQFDLLARAAAQTPLEDLPALRYELTPLAPKLIAPMLALAEQPSLPAAHRQALRWMLLEWAREQPALAARLLCQVEPAHFDALLRNVSEKYRGELCTRLAFLLNTQAQPGNDRARIAQRRRQAKAAIALLRLGAQQQLAPLWAATEDRELESQFLANLRRYGARPENVLPLAHHANTAPARRLWLLALGEFALAELPEEFRERTLERVRSLYGSDPDSGVHGACHWLLNAWGLRREALALEARLAAQAPDTQNQWKVCKPADVPMTMVRFQPGEFQMGSPLAEPGRDWQEQPHLVRITRAFWLCDRLVTRGEFASFLRATQGDARAEEYVRSVAGYASEDCAPAVMVSWHDAVAYCRWLTAPAGESIAQCYLPKEGDAADWEFDAARGGFRLPTEAEWEYACRSGTSTAYSFGNDPALLCRYGWYDANAAGQDRAGRERRPNPRGIAGMHGCTLEWCQDWFGVYSQDALVDPLGPATGQCRVLRAGSYLSSAAAARSAARTLLPPWFAGPLTGFRVAATDQ